MTYTSDEKSLPFNRFSVQGTGVSPSGPDPENRVGDQDTGRPGRPVSSVMQVPSETEYFRQEQDTLRDLPGEFSLQNVL